MTNLHQVAWHGREHKLDGFCHLGKHGQVYQGAAEPLGVPTFNEKLPDLAG